MSELLLGVSNLREVVMSQSVLEKIKEDKIIAIVRGIKSADISALAEALMEGGLHCIEVTYDQSSEEAKEDTLKSIQILSEQYSGQVLTGAGTVMSSDEVDAAVEAGAEYIISPNVDESVIRRTKELERISIPGALTPTEAASAYAYGADIIKLFPAGVLGPAYIKSICGPLNYIPFTAVGGISPENCADFLKAGAIGIGCGGNLVSKKLVEEGNFAAITATAKAYQEILSQF